MAHDGTEDPKKQSTAKFEVEVSETSVTPSRHAYKQTYRNHDKTLIFFFISVRPQSSTSCVLAIAILHPPRPR